MKKYNGTYVKLGADNDTHMDSVNRSAFKDNYNIARDLNNIDKSYIQTIKQVNWNFSDAAIGDSSSP